MGVTKIYTRLGDDGETRLANGEKIAKSSLRIEAYGTIDELNACVGMLKDSLAERNASKYEDINMIMNKIQNDLFEIGSELAFPEGNHRGLMLVGLKETELLERDIDRMSEELEPLVNFVLPGGNTANSISHIARTTCRRAERVVVSLAETVVVRGAVLQYLNRLSDWFFVLGRYILMKEGKEEILWRSRK